MACQIDRIRELAESWHYTAEIAKTLGLSFYHVRKLSDQNGIGIPSQTEVKYRRIKAMSDSGLFNRDICDGLGKTRRAVGVFCDKYGIAKNVPPQIGPYRYPKDKFKKAKVRLSASPDALARYQASG